MKLVLAIGCFDILHAGHIQHLKEARSLGDRLIVALTVDECVNKGPNRPVYPWHLRAMDLMELRCVDEVIANRNGADTIRRVRPDVFVKGMDASPHGEDLLKACADVGAKISFTSLKTVGDKKISSTDLCAF